MAADTEYWQNILFNICTRSTLGDYLNFVGQNKKVDDFS